MKRTTIALPVSLLDKLVQGSRTATKTEAVVLAIQEAVRRRKIEDIDRQAGTLRFTLTAEQIRHGGHRLDRSRSR